MSKVKSGSLSAAFERNSAAISLLIIATLAVAVLSTAYFGLAFTRSQFDNLTSVKEYDNLLTDVTTMDDLSRTQFYWSNNLQVAGLYAATFPLYIGANSSILNGYQIGLALIFNYHAYGLDAMLAFAGLIFVHGILEITGVFIIGGASLRLAWKFWDFFGRALEGGIGKMTRRRKAAAALYARDYIMMVALGAFMIFLAAPIEAYVSPFAGGMFLLLPILALVYLGVVLIVYASIVRRGLPRMRRAFASELRGAKSMASGKWWPGFLPLLMLIIFSFMLWISSI